MTNRDALDELAALVRGRMQLALREKAIFEREQQRLNSQLMQGEVNMATAVLAWLDRLGAGATPAVQDDDDEEQGEERE